MKFCLRVCLTVSVLMAVSLLSKGEFVFTCIYFGVSTFESSVEILIS